MWVVLTAGLVQYLTSKAGPATGRTLPELCRDRFGRRANTIGGNAQTGGLSIWWEGALPRPMPEHQHCPGRGGTGTGVAGDQVVLWDCNGSGAEQWKEVQGTWLNPASGLCLDDLDGNTTNGWQLDVETCDGHDDQLFVTNPPCV